ncbi:MAG: hypothetical protein ABIK96_13775 [bacterium]
MVKFIQICREITLHGLAILILGLLPNLAAAGDTEICGFADFVATPLQNGGSPSPFAMGQAELDFTRKLDPHWQACIAVAYDADTEAFGLGAWTLTYAVERHDESCCGSRCFVHSTGFTVGRFDVPVGIDWLVYPSPSRLLVTAPVAADATHAGWNDQGFLALFEGKRFFGAAFLTNGTLLTEEVPGQAAGGRIAIRYPCCLEIGISGAAAWNVDDLHRATLKGADIQARLGSLGLKGEYLELRDGIGTEDLGVRAGFYSQVHLQSGRNHVVLRYGALTTSGNARPRPLSLGAGREIAPGLQLRCQYEDDTVSSADRLLVQTVVLF